MGALVTGLFRYPLKGFSPEALETIELKPGETVPYDRAYAVENGVSGFDPAAPAYFPKIRFLMLMKNAEVAKIRSRFDPATSELTLMENHEVVARGRLDTIEGRGAIEAFIMARFETELRGPPRILSAPGHSFSDVAAKVIHLVNLASVRDLERQVGRPIDPLRFRANIYVDGIPAWSEFDLVGGHGTVGGLILAGTKRTERCAATDVDPSTGARDMQIPRTLMGAYGHSDMGVYVKVTRAGSIAVGDRLALSPMAVTDQLPL
jgi:uncharacterized protein YcbX